MVRYLCGSIFAVTLLSVLQPTASQEHSPWIFRYFIERMDCIVDNDEAAHWNDIHSFLFQAKENDQPQEQRLAILGAALKDLLVPFGVADPVVSLGCPLGTSAALQELASLCVNILGERCVQRGLRLVHLSKLFMLFNFNDFGAWFEHTRWRTNQPGLHSMAQGLIELARKDEKSYAATVAEPANVRIPGLRIGLVTYCNYNDSATNLTSFSRTSKGAYAERHGYTLLHVETPYVTQAHPWMNKLIAVQQHLKDFDWLFWVDCDLFFMNPTKTVDALIQAAYDRNPEASLLIAEDGMMLNSGAFLLRNNEWGADFLARTVDLLSAPMPQSFQHMPWHEQAPLMYLTLIPSILDGLAGQDLSMTLGSDSSLSSGYDERVVMLKQSSMNSYPMEVVEKTGHALPHHGFQEGDMVISFNGCASILGREFCEDMYARYHAQSLERFASEKTGSSWWR
eukprot:TRINITY_DN12333_c2_g1_i1.p1 TRINITY_DN12333_c2_g1~~TRINITY_DN12333_c2_g1_i1.p1  ORF type:complete len:477 (+),score=59.69 TRINITY_DN12333_c2_g1_i1:73-1431(+)